MTAPLAPAVGAAAGVVPRRQVWLAIAKETAAEAVRDDVASLAAAVAFRLFLSLFPSLIAGVAILNLVITRSEVEQLVTTLSGVAPRAVVDLFVEVVGVDGRGAGGVVAFGVALGVWAASSAAVALMKALSRARAQAETRTFLALRLTGLVITVALFVAIAVLLVLLVFGPQIQDALLPPIAGGALRALATVGRHLAAVLVLQVLLAFIYWIGPDRRVRPRWRWLTPGAVLGVVGWLLASFGFSLYTRFFGSYVGNPAYAGFGAVIVVLLWLQLTMLLLLVGAELNFVIERRRRASQEVQAGAGFAVVDPLAAMGEVERAAAEGIGPAGSPQPQAVPQPETAALSPPPPAAPPRGRRRWLPLGVAVPLLLLAAAAAWQRRGRSTPPPAARGR